MLKKCIMPLKYALQQCTVHHFIFLYCVNKGWVNNSLAEGRCSFDLSRQRNNTSLRGGDKLSGIGGVESEMPI